MNSPFDRIHSVDFGYGWLVFPWFGGWLTFAASGRWWRFARSGRFHNCRVTGIG